MTRRIYLIPHEDDLRINDPIDPFMTFVDEAAELRERAGMYYQRDPRGLTDRQIAVFGIMEAMGLVVPR